VDLRITEILQVIRQAWRYPCAVVPIGADQLSPTIILSPLVTVTPIPSLQVYMLELVDDAGVDVWPQFIDLSIEHDHPVILLGDRGFLQLQGKVIFLRAGVDLRINENKGHSQNMTKRGALSIVGRKKSLYTIF
jgi:hypothetical protein